MLGKLRNAVFFQCSVVPGGRKVGSLKRRVRRHLERGVIKKCQNTSRFNDFEVKSDKSVKTPQLRGTFGKLTSQKCQNASCFNDFEVKSVKTSHARSTFGS